MKWNDNSKWNLYAIHRNLATNITYKMWNEWTNGSIQIKEWIKYAYKMYLK